MGNVHRVKSLAMKETTLLKLRVFKKILLAVKKTCGVKVLSHQTLLKKKKLVHDQLLYIF